MLLQILYTGVKHMNINIIITSLQVGINATVVPNDDGTYTILVNKHLTKEKMIKAILHELQHIENNDWGAEEQAAIIESLVNNSFHDVDINDYNLFFKVV